MKEKLTNNIGLKLLSLMLATLLWLVVINSQDPVETRIFEDIPVTIINEDSLTAKDKIPEVVEGDKVSVSVEARRSICDKLTKNDIVAVADFEKISVTDAVPIDISVKGYTNHEVEIVRGMNQVMKLRLEDSMTKDFRVKISTTGQTKEGYVIGDMVASPNMITLTGSSTQISKIKEVVLVVDVDGISKDSLSTGVPVIYDMNGDVVSSGKVTMSTNEVQVTIPVLKTKTVRILVKTIGEPEPGYEVSTVSYQPDMVTIAGTLSDLVLLGNTLTAYCDISGQNGTVEENIDISSLWDPDYESIRLVDEEKLAVTITLKEYEEKVMEISESAIEIRGLAENLEAVVTELSKHQVRIKGKRDSLVGVTLDSLEPYIDLSGYTSSGAYTVVVSLENLRDLQLQSILFADVVVSVTEKVPVSTTHLQEPENNPESDNNGSTQENMAGLTGQEVSEGESQ